ncbi:tryptophanase [Sunxiuqinia elliptica]|uniref:Tyrosine phenol-lyase n=1 Tax=Sunxiuqinia elliptica TaxID=655355 RepID=A0A4R6H1N1_9BACT|nr:tryptophanase [Sunxiuqinia elliptica]TDO01156.1 tyrosine phenol-lyase [Sunxiuqinia elliptica]TDO57667.1 tyrosine phenol-lyase [Sunxiuqinia elliptica]
MDLPFAENYRIKMVEPIYRSTRKEREEWIKQADYNLFNLPSEHVFIDLLTDSGTGAMSDRQWGALMTGDESYAGSSSYFNLKKQVKEIFGFDHFLPVHQGRAAENVLFSVLVKKGDVVPGNSHFDTTKGHIEFRKAKAIDCSVDEAFDTNGNHPFKGNIDLEKLTQVLESYPHEQVPMIIVTLTCNSSGGQPVSLANLREVRQLADRYEIPVIFDSARFAENAWFIQNREPGYQDKTIREIVREMYELADGMTMSSKKDGIVNIGGILAMRHEDWFQQASVYNIMYEGFNTYGGMAGRDMNALAVGLDEVTSADYLENRIRQVHYLGNQLINMGIPVQNPLGGHAVFVDAKRFLTQVPKEQFIAQTLAIELYLEAGVRGVEVGTLLADRDPVTKENRYPKLEFLRLAIPRRTYTNNHMDVVAAGLKNIFDRRESITSGFQITQEAPIMRHFTVKLKPQ